MSSALRSSCALLMLLCPFASILAADAVIPHGQSKPPGPALSPAEAVRRMTVPEGFSVEVVAA